MVLTVVLYECESVMWVGKFPAVL